MSYQLWLSCVSEQFNDSTPVEVKCKTVLFFHHTTSFPFPAGIGTQWLAMGRITIYRTSKMWGFLTICVLHCCA